MNDDGGDAGIYNIHVYCVHSCPNNVRRTHQFYPHSSMKSEKQYYENYKQTKMFQFSKENNERDVC